MKKMILFAIQILLLASIVQEAHATPRLRVVTTLPDYKYFAETIGGDRVEVNAIVRGDQDAHFIRPKPSFVSLVREADVLISTGLDLELWLPTVVNKSGNTRVRSGEVGYVAVAQGVRMLEVPHVMSRSEGGVHIYGNPHFTSDPIAMKVVIRNITIGLIKNDPEGRDQYIENRDRLLMRIDDSLFGSDLVKLIGGDTLCKLSQKGALIDFLEKQQFKGEPLIDHLGGWLKEMLPLRGTPIVTYHKNWVYFEQLLGLREVGTIEPKPGIPPSAKHVTELVEQMRTREVKILLAANYFDEQKIKTVAGRVDAAAVIVPMYLGGAPGTDDYFQLVDYWVSHLLDAGMEKGLISGNAVPGRQ